MKYLMKHFLMILLLVTFSFDTFGTSEPYTAKVSNIRIESSYGFIAMEGTLPWAQELGCSSERVWVDLTNEIGKLHYSTALSAMVAGKKLYVRVNSSSSTHIYGACKLHDMVVFAN